MHVYIVFTLGTGDDEDAWEVTSVHFSKLGAERACVALHLQGVEAKHEPHAVNE